MASIVVVDDERDLAESVEMLLAGEGHAVRVALDGREGLALVCESIPDLVVLDVEMPRLGGPAMALEMLIRDCGLELVPIVLVSGMPNLEAIAARVGTPYVLAKPFDVDRFLALVARALAERCEPRPDRTAPADGS
jgi:DNA-binding NtrC family response regulator